MVLFESNVGLPGETTRIRLQGMHEALNLSADLLVSGLPPISQDCGAALPWLAGTITQSAGIRVLMPFTVVLALLQFAVWWPLASLIRGPAPVVSSQQAG